MRRHVSFSFMIKLLNNLNVVSSNSTSGTKFLSTATYSWCYIKQKNLYSYNLNAEKCVQQTHFWLKSRAIQEYLGLSTTPSLLEENWGRWSARLRILVNCFIFLDSRKCRGVYETWFYCLIDFLNAQKYFLKLWTKKDVIIFLDTLEAYTQQSMCF